MTMKLPGFDELPTTWDKHDFSPEGAAFLRKEEPDLAMMLDLLDRELEQLFKICAEGHQAEGPGVAFMRMGLKMMVHRHQTIELLQNHIRLKLDHRRMSETVFKIPADMLLGEENG